MPKKRMAQRDIDIAQASMLVFHVPTAWDDLKSGTANRWSLDNGARVSYTVSGPGNARFDIIVNPVGKWGSSDKELRESSNGLSDYAYICKWVADDDHLILPPEKIWKAHFARMLLELRDRIREAE